MRMRIKVLINKGYKKGLKVQTHSEFSALKNSKHFYIVYLWDKRHYCDLDSQHVSFVDLISLAEKID